jgi:membrane-associated protease RseP (regulator of RpoE activity)
LTDDPARLSSPVPVGPAETIRRPFSPWVNLVLLILTVLTTHVAGIFLNPEEFDVADLASRLGDPGFWIRGSAYGLPVLFILGTHEMGHYLACRRYGVPATLPFFIPGPPIFGTFGAVIRIRGPIPDRRALFDIGMAGPIAGFLAAIPVLLYGLSRSSAWGEAPSEGAISLPSCLLLSVLEPVFFPVVATGEAIRAHPSYVAAWVGMFATGLNLLPIGQLDGGHILYSLSPRLHRIVTRFGVIVLIVAGVHWGGWHLVVFGVIFGILGPRHPPTLETWTTPGPRRIAVAVIGALILALTLIVRGPSVI